MWRGKTTCRMKFGQWSILTPQMQVEHLVEVDGGGGRQRTLLRPKPGGRQQRRAALEERLSGADKYGP